VRRDRRSRDDIGKSRGYGLTKIQLDIRFQDKSNTAGRIGEGQMKKLSFVVLVLFAFFSSCSSPSSSDKQEPIGPTTGTITGIINEAGTGAAVAGASVHTNPATTTTTTDSQGKYTISNVTPGSYVITAEAEGYMEHSMTINVTSGQTTPADLTLQLDYSGNWSGTTSQDESISFILAENAIKSFTFGYRLKQPGTRISGTVEITYSPPQSIAANKFTLSGMTIVSSYPSNIDLAFTFDGTFTSAKAGEGTMKLTFSGGATAEVSGTWTISKS